MKQLFRSAVCLAAALCASPAAGQQVRFDDVVRNLRNPDAKVRMSAVRLLREAQYPEAVVPMAPLVNDPVNEVQFEAIAAELSFFMVEKVPERRKVGFLIELRSSGGAPGAFDLGPLAVWPKPAPPQVIEALLKAVDDETAKVRLEAVHAIGVIGARSLTPESEAALVKTLDHYDPGVRAAAARVVGRLEVKAAGDLLIKAVNDSSRDVRYAAMRALGEIREARAVEALTDQLAYYGKGEGAWSAAEALARIAHPSSVPVFARLLTHKDPMLRRAAAEGLGRTGDTSQLSTLQAGAGNDFAATTRAAMAFALHKLGHHYVTRLVDFLTHDELALQVQDYLLELGPEIEAQLLPRLQEPDEAIRARVAEVLGAIGSDASLAPLRGLLARDKDRDTAEAAERALERIKMRRG
jgi:HEAT repeat protein